MADVFNFDKFMYTYIVFLAFFIFIIGLGANEFFTGDNAKLLEAASFNPTLNPNASTNTVTNPIINVLDWFRTTFIDLTGIDAAGWMESTFGPFHSFMENIWLFIKMALVDPGTGAVATLVFTPAMLFLTWGIIRLVRGGG